LFNLGRGRSRSRGSFERRGREGCAESAEGRQRKPKNTKIGKKKKKEKLKPKII
jgi:hypothetical protein